MKSLLYGTAAFALIMAAGPLAAQTGDGLNDSSHNAAPMAPSPAPTAAPDRQVEPSGSSSPEAVAPTPPPAAHHADAARRQENRKEAAETELLNQQALANAMGIPTPPEGSGSSNPEPAPK